MCQCLDQLEKDMLKYVTEKHAALGHTVLPLNSSMHDDGLDNTHLILPTKEDLEKFEVTGVQLHTKFAFRYTFEKKDKTTSKPKREHVSISFTYCPICGEPYKKPKAEQQPVPEYTDKELSLALPKFTKIWAEDKNTEANPMPEGVKLTVYCEGDSPEDRGFSENVTSSELGLNALIAHSWILQTDLDNIIKEMRANG